MTEKWVPKVGERVIQFTEVTKDDKWPELFAWFNEGGFVDDLNYLRPDPTPILECFVARESPRPIPEGGPLFCFSCTRYATDGIPPPPPDGKEGHYAGCLWMAAKAWLERK